MSKAALRRHLEAAERSIACLETRHAWTWGKVKTLTAELDAAHKKIKALEVDLAASDIHEWRKDANPFSLSERIDKLAREVERRIAPMEKAIMNLYGPRTIKCPHCDGTGNLIT